MPEPDEKAPRGLRARVRRLAGNGFLRSVLLLLGSASLGQAILLGALAISSRLYSPADFGALAVFNAVVGIVAVGACLRYDIAVALPDSRHDSADLLALALACAAVSALLCGALIGLMPRSALESLFGPSVLAYLWLAPVAIFLSASVSALQQWYVREKAFPVIAQSRIGQAICHASVQVSAGFAKVGPVGLIAAQLVNFLAGAILLVARLSGAGTGRPLRERLKRIRALAVEYRRFPQYSTLEALFNAAGILAPVILIGALAPASEAGHLLMAMYVMQASLTLVGMAISQVYFSRAPAEHAAGNLAAFTRGILAKLIMVGPGPLLFIGVTASFAVPILFGTSWARSGVLVAWMTPWFVMQFVSSPISLALSVTGHQKEAFLLQAAGFALRTMSVVGVWLLSFSWITESYAVSGFLFYAAYLAVILRTTGIQARDFWSDVARAAPSVVAWLSAGLLTAAAIAFFARSA